LRIRSVPQGFPLRLQAIQPKEQKIPNFNFGECTFTSRRNFDLIASAGAARLCQQHTAFHEKQNKDELSQKVRKASLLLIIPRILDEDNSCPGESSTRDQLS
jgi:hypothetical protein